MRVEHEYQRKGALALLAALDVRTGTVSATTPKTTGIAPFMALMGQIMSQKPYKNTPRVFVIVDNGSDHRGKKAIRRLRHAHPNCIMIHTPVHASWLNQIEIFFSIIQKKVVSPNDFTSLAALEHTPCSPSLTATTRPPGRSTGSSPPQIWPGCSTGSAPVRNPPRNLPACQMPPDGPPTNFQPYPLSVGVDASIVEPRCMAGDGTASTVRATLRFSSLRLVPQ
jgi:hypothetical protein